MTLLFSKCSCDASDLQRIPRAFWMRMFPSKRLYYCQVCRSKIFTDRDLVVQMAWENTTMKMLDGKPVSGRGFRNSGRDTVPAPY